MHIRRFSCICLLERFYFFFVRIMVAPRAKMTAPSRMMKADSKSVP